MNKAAIWFWLSCKRYLKRLPFLAVLLLLPLGAMVIRRAEKKGDEKIQIAVCSLDQEGSLGSRLADSLASRPSSEEEGMFFFYLCRDKEQVKEEVASRRAECGYVICEGLEEKLDHRQFKRSIEVYSAPSTVAAALSTETVFAALMELYDKELLMDYAGDGEAFQSLGEPGSPERQEARQKAGELYEKWTENGSTFRFVYFYGEEGGREVGEGLKNAGGESGSGTRRTAGAEKAPGLFPVRGLAAVCIFITGLYGAVVLGADEKRGLFHPLDCQLRFPCQLASLAAPVTLAACAGLLAVWAGGEGEELIKELGAMTGYAAAVTAAAWALKLICPSPQALCCTIPFFIIGSLVFCPVFINAGKLFEGFDLAGKCFLPYYYLRIFS